MTQAGKSGINEFATPDPVFTYETALALAATVVTNIILLLGLDLSEARKAAVLGLVNGSVTIGFLIYAAVIRHGRAVGNAKR
jgi:hypothetical protein